MRKNFKGIFSLLAIILLMLTGGRSGTFILLETISDKNQLAM